MKRQRLQKRRERNQALAKMDAANRCAYCKAPLPPNKVVVNLLSAGWFCSSECASDARIVRNMLAK